MGGSIMAGTYLDNQGNPITAPSAQATTQTTQATTAPVYLDEQGNAITPETQAPQPQSMLSKIGQGVEQSQIGQMVAPPADAKEHIALTLGGPTALPLYRMAKGIVSSVENLYKAPGEKFEQAKQDFSNTIDDVKQGKYGQATSDAVSGVADTIPVPDVLGVGSRTRELAQGAKPGGDLATPLTKDALDAITMAVASRLGAGSEETEPSLMQKAIKGEKAVEPAATNAVSNIASKVTAKAGVEAPEAGVSAFGDSGENIIAQAKQSYAKIDAATEGKFQANQNALQANQRAFRTAESESDINSANAERAKLLTEQEQIFSDAEKAGVPKETVDAARAAYKQGSALQDTDNQVWLSRNKSASATDENGMPTSVVPRTLLPRLQNLYKAGRLQEAVGEDNAIDLLKQTKDLANQGIKAATIHKLAIGAGSAVGLGALGSIGYEITK